MKIKPFLIVAFALLAYLHGPTALAQVCNSVTVGTTDTDTGGGPPNNDANLSMVVLEFCGGRVKGQWQDTFFRGVAGVHIAVTCVAVVGDDAWVSGIFKKVSKGFEFLLGLPAIIRVQDNGNAVNGGIDRASPGFLAGDDQDCLLMPALQLFDLSNGEVRIN